MASIRQPLGKGKKGRGWAARQGGGAGAWLGCDAKGEGLGSASAWLRCKGGEAGQQDKGKGAGQRWTKAKGECDRPSTIRPFRRGPSSLLAAPSESVVPCSLIRLSILHCVCVCVVTHDQIPGCIWAASPQTIAVVVFVTIIIYHVWLAI